MLPVSLPTYFYNFFLDSQIDRLFVRCSLFFVSDFSPQIVVVVFSLGDIVQCWSLCWLRLINFCTLLIFVALRYLWKHFTNAACGVFCVHLQSRIRGTFGGKEASTCMFVYAYVYCLCTTFDSVNEVSTEWSKLKLWNLLNVTANKTTRYTLPHVYMRTSTRVVDERNEKKIIPVLHWPVRRKTIFLWKVCVSGRIIYNRSVSSLIWRFVDLLMGQSK